MSDRSKFIMTNTCVVLAISSTIYQEIQNLPFHSLSFIMTPVIKYTLVMHLGRAGEMG